MKGMSGRENHDQYIEESKGEMDSAIRPTMIYSLKLVK